MVAEPPPRHQAPAAPVVEEKKITIGDMIAEKERARAEKESEEAGEFLEEPTEAPEETEEVT